jgi:hypothetical protein
MFKSFSRRLATLTLASLLSSSSMLHAEQNQPQPTLDWCAKHQRQDDCAFAARREFCAWNAGECQVDDERLAQKMLVSAYVLTGVVAVVGGLALLKVCQR